MSGEREQLADYLLRRAPNEERERIEERLFGEEEFASQLEDAERDLFDAYARGELSAADRAAVDTCLLTSDSQREKLRFAYALATKTKSSVHLGRYWLAAAALMLAALCGALSIQNWRLRVELAGLNATPARPADGAAVSFLLSPVERGSNPEILRLAPGVNPSGLDFPLGAGAGTAVDVRIARRTGKVVLQENAVVPRSLQGLSYASIGLPAAALPPGDYSATVGRDLTFAFRISRWY